VRIWFVLVLLVACKPPEHPHATRGGLAGVARDHDSGDAIEQAIIEFAGHQVTSSATGAYQLGDLAPGSYQLKASFAGQPLTVDHVVVRAGNTTIVDLTVTLGRPDPIHYDFLALTLIDRYHPKRLAPDVASFEGTVNDAANHDRIAGAVVTAIGPGDGPASTTLQTVSDDQGRYRFETVPPGRYVISTYYSVDAHAQIEVRRSDIDAAGGEALVVPLWLEANR
jgi:hypothetical protein